MTLCFTSSPFKKWWTGSNRFANSTKHSDARFLFPSPLYICAIFIYVDYFHYIYFRAGKIQALWNNESWLMRYFVMIALWLIKTTERICISSLGFSATDHTVVIRHHFLSFTLSISITAMNEPCIRLCLNYNIITIAMWVTIASQST